MSYHWLWTLLGALVLYAIIDASVKAPGNALRAKFAELGELKGKTRQQIIAAVGPPNSVSAGAEGRQVIQWIVTSYHVALVFDADGVCEGVSHEFAA